MHPASNLWQIITKWRFYVDQMSNILQWHQNLEVITIEHASRDFVASSWRHYSWGISPACLWQTSHETMTTRCPTHPSKLVDRVHIHIILLHLLAIHRHLLYLSIVDILWPATFRVVYTVRVCLKPFSIHLAMCTDVISIPYTINIANLYIVHMSYIWSDVKPDTIVPIKT